MEPCGSMQKLKKCSLDKMNYWISHRKKYKLNSYVIGLF